MFGSNKVSMQYTRGVLISGCPHLRVRNLDYLVIVCCCCSSCCCFLAGIIWLLLNTRELDYLGQKTRGDPRWVMHVVLMLNKFRK